MPQYTEPFFIVVNPVASKFAKVLQRGLQQCVTNRILRTSKPVRKAGRSWFAVTPIVLNKIQQLERFTNAGISCPSFETSSGKLRESGISVWFARTLINSTNGKGIVEFDLREQQHIPEAPLYTEYIPKKSEYRFHVFNGHIIDVQQKKKVRGGEHNPRVRNLHNGYVYCRDDIQPPADAAALAVAATLACGYAYGAVDIIHNEKRGQSYVLEVNSRPGLMGTTLERYVDALIKRYNLGRR